MNGRTDMLLMLVLSICWVGPIPASGVDDALSATGAKITLGTMKVTSSNLEMRYLIRNDSAGDIWICADMNIDHPWDFEAYAPEEGHTLVIRRRFDVPMRGYGEPPRVRYIRLRPGEERSEAMSLRVPLYDHLILRGAAAERTGNVERVSLEIGYYDQDLLRMVRRAFSEWDDTYGPGPHETVSAAGEATQISFPYPFGKVSGERVLRIAVDGIGVPYVPMPDVEANRPPTRVGATSIELLRDLFYGGSISLEDQRYAERLLSCNPALYNEMADRIARVYLAVAEGTEPPTRLDSLLAEVGDPNQRQQALEVVLQRSDESR